MSFQFCIGTSTSEAVDGVKEQRGLPVSVWKLEEKSWEGDLRKLGYNSKHLAFVWTGGAYQMTELKDYLLQVIGARSMLM